MKFFLMLLMYIAGLTCLAYTNSQLGWVAGGYATGFWCGWYLGLPNAIKSTEGVGKKPS